MPTGKDKCGFAQVVPLANTVKCIQKRVCSFANRVRAAKRQIRKEANRFLRVYVSLEQFLMCMVAVRCAAQALLRLAQKPRVSNVRTGRTPARPRRSVHNARVPMKSMALCDGPRQSPSLRLQTASHFVTWAMAQQRRRVCGAENILSQMCSRSKLAKHVMQPNAALLKEIIAFAQQARTVSILGADAPRASTGCAVARQ